MKSPIDRRRDLPRLERNIKAEVAIGRRSHICVVENSSPAGAALRLEAGILLPPSFQLVLEGRRVEAALAWRTGDKVGVLFTSPWRKA